MKMDYFDETKMSNDTQNAETVFASDAEHKSDVSAGHTYSVGETLADLYQVKSEPISGGMGSVICVHHSSWNVDLAMKQPHLQTLDDARRQLFVHECEAWINLGLHRNIVACYYVRVIDGVPSIFSEWMDGGSLKDQIFSKQLYKGNSNEILARIIDIMIQSARGLAFAHSKGLIHQDVKPANILCNKGGDIKIADFGLANVKKLIVSTDATDSGKTAFAANGGYTLQYCSPEQIKGLPLSARSDIWSWAVTALEMLVGECKWSTGPLAGYAFEDYLKDSIVSVPDAIRTLLGDCFHEKENERPHDFNAVITRLLSIYTRINGEEYPAELDIDSNRNVEFLNNKALSFLDLGNQDEAKSLWEKALELAPNHPTVQFNYTLFKWRTGVITDLEAIEHLKSLKTKMNSPELSYGLASIYCESGRYSMARRLIASSLDEFPKDSHLPMLQTKCENKDDIFTVVAETIINDKEITIFPGGIQYNSSNDLIYLNPVTSDNTTVFVLLDRFGDIVSKKIIETDSAKRVFFFLFSKDYRQIIVQRADGSIDVLDAESFQLLSHIFDWNGKEAKGIPFGICGDVEDGLIATYMDLDGNTWGIIQRRRLTHLISRNDIREAVKRCLPSHFPTGKPSLLDSIHHTYYDEQYDTISCFNSDGTIACGKYNITLMKDGQFSIGQSSKAKKEKTELRPDLNELRDHHAGSFVFERPYEQDVLTVIDSQSQQIVYTYPHAIRHIIASADYSRSYAVEDKNVVTRTLFSDRFFCEYMLSKVISISDIDQNEKQFITYYSHAKEKYLAGEYESALQYIDKAAEIPGYNKNPILMALNREVGRFCKIQSFWNVEIGVKATADKTGSFFDHDRINRFVRWDKNNIIDVLTNKPYPCAASGSRIIIGSKALDFSAFLISEREKRGEAFLAGLKSAKDIYNDPRSQAIAYWLATGRKGEYPGPSPEEADKYFTDEKEQLLVTQHNNGAIYLWNLHTGGKACLQPPTSKENMLVLQDFSPDGSSYALFDRKTSTVSIASTMQDLIGGRPHSFVCKGITVDSVRVQDDDIAFGAYLDSCHYLTCNKKWQVVIWDIEKEEPVSACEPRGLGLSDINMGGGYSISPNHRFFLVSEERSNENNAIVLYDLQNKEAIHCTTLPGINYSVTCGNPCSLTANKNVFITHEYWWNEEKRRRTYNFINWKYEFPGWVDWDDQALPVVQDFLEAHGTLTSDDINDLMLVLQNKDLGWIRREGIVRKVNELVQERRAKYRNEGKCEYCGGRFKGLFRKVCENCGRPKNY